MSHCFFSIFKIKEKNESKQDLFEAGIRVLLWDLGKYNFGLNRQFSIDVER